MSNHSTEKHLALVVEDDDLLRELVKVNLERAGYQVIEAGDAGVALRTLKENSPDIIISDIDMPGLNGIELCRLIRDNNATLETPFIFMSANRAVDIRLRGFSVGADDFLVKPFDFDELIARAQIKLSRHARAVEGSTIDHLTGLCNRKSIEKKLEEEVARCTRFGSTFSLALIDIDHFKKINDTFGHQAGDNALRAISKKLKESIREIDTVGRYGGEEFVLIIPETEAPAAVAAVDRIRGELAGSKIKLMDGCAKNVTFSAGVAQFKLHGSTIDDIVHAADKALYLAKEEGRNKVLPFSGDISGAA